MRARYLILTVVSLVGCTAREESDNATGAQQAGKRQKSAPTSRPTPTATPAAAPSSVPAPVGAIGKWYRAGPYRLRSLVPGVSLLPTADLPSVDYIGDQDGFCREGDPGPSTPEGRWARSRGWRVGVEKRLGQLTFVNVMRRYEYYAGGCGQINGKVLLFRHHLPIAAVTVTSPLPDTLGIDDLKSMPHDTLRLTNLEVMPLGDQV